jgi:hypothetical protein
MSQNGVLSFTQAMEQLIEWRASIVARRLAKDPEYRRLREKAKQLFDSCIKPKVPLAEYDQYETAEARQAGMFMTEMYLEGLRDGLALAGILKGDRTLLFHEGTPGSEKLCREDAGTAKVVF